MRPFRGIVSQAMGRRTPGVSCLWVLFLIDSKKRSKSRAAANRHVLVFWLTLVRARKWRPVRGNETLYLRDACCSSRIIEKEKEFTRFAKTQTAVGFPEQRNGNPNGMTGIYQPEQRRRMGRLSSGGKPKTMSNWLPCSTLCCRDADVPRVYNLRQPQACRAVTWRRDSPISVQSKSDSNQAPPQNQATSPRRYKKNQTGFEFVRHGEFAKASKSLPAGRGLQVMRIALNAERLDRRWRRMVRRSTSRSRADYETRFSRSHPSLWT